MELSTLGDSDLEVSPIGFGAFKIGRNLKTKYAEHYELPDDATVHRLLDGVLDAGINLVDTAPAYGSSEARIGEYLKASGRRSEIVLSTKVGERFQDGHSSYAFDRTSISNSIDASLKRLGTDRLDIVCVHSNGDDLEIIHQSDVLEVLAERRRRGDIGEVGFSGKTLEGHQACLAPELGVRVLMVELNPLETAQAALLEDAQTAGVGILVKKGLASGRLSASEALPWLLSHEQVGSVVVGGLSLEHIRENVRLVEA
jgi:aryl-alcohol dehydrogenase-like predicted oxidoreductase